MVGVPGKSKGCATCRRRKKGCDQARPTCGNCKQSGYECLGYKRELTFVHHAASQAVQHATFAPLARTDNEPLKIVPFYIWEPAIEMQCRSLFWDLYMPRGDCEVRDRHILACKHPMNWTIMVPELPGAEPSLERAFSALSIARVGRDNEDERLIRVSAKLYGKALKDVQKALYDPSRVFSDEVLTACMVLSLYEVFEGSARKDFGWVSHTQGAAKLLQLRGAHRHATRQAHHVFLGSRLPTLYAAILQRKTTFLASPEWLTLPWALENRTFHDRLVDLMTGIPTLLERTDIALSIRDPVLAVREQLKMLEACQQIEKALDGWRAGMKKTAGETAMEHKHRDGDDYPFKYDFTYENHLFARTQAVYWSCHLVVSDTMHDLQVSLERLIVNSTSLPSASESIHKKSRSYAVNIAQAIDYFLLPEMGALGADLISFPMGLAYRFFSQSQEHDICAWFGNSLENMKKRGFHIGRFLGAFSAEDSSRRRHGSSESSDARDAHNTSPISIESYSSGATLVQEEPPQVK
jgi:hypothetical protein